MLISTGGRTVDEVLNACVFGCLRQVFTLEYLPGWIMWHVGLYTMERHGRSGRPARLPLPHLLAPVRLLYEGRE